MSPRPMLIAPSLLSCDFARLAEEVHRIEEAGADWLHVDVMDGHFVPNLTIGPPVVAALARVARAPLDVHVMIENPARWVEAYAKAGAQVWTFHAEAVDGLEGAKEVIAACREQGIPKVGLALNPDTPLEPWEPLLDELDMVLVMSVFPGFGGQSFMAEVLDKTRRLRRIGFQGHVQMDGGLNAETLPLCAEAGADVLVSGSAIFGAPDVKQRIDEFRQLAEAAVAANPS